MTDPSPPNGAPASAPISFGRAVAVAAAAFAATWAAGLLAAGFAASVGLLVLGWAAWRGVLRSPQWVMAEATWLVVGVILKLAFLEAMPAAPLPVFAGMLLVSYGAQLFCDLRAFARTEDGRRTPPVTYAVSFALTTTLCAATELFRAARADYPGFLGIFLAMTLAASLFLLLVVWWDWTKKAFGSLTMAVTLLSLIGVGSIVGTFVIQHMPEESVEAHYDKFMNGEGAAPVNARYLFRDPAVEWSDADDARRVAMNEKFGAGQGDRWRKIVLHDRVKAAKQAEAQKWVAAHRDELHRFYELCESTQASRIFKSWYYNALLVLLAFTVVGVMARRFPFEKKDAGWVSTHAGIVFTLICLAGSDLLVRDGFVQLAPTARPGESGLPTETQSFEDLLDGGRSKDFGWTLRLVRTSADWYQSLVVSFAGDDGRVAAQQTYPVLPGKVIELERPSKDAPPRYKVEILDVLERCRPANVGYREGAAPSFTALSLRVEEGGQSFERWIGGEESTLPLPGGVLRLVVAENSDEEAAAAAPSMPAGAGAIGFIRVVADGGELARVPATSGEKTEFASGGKTWRVTVGDVSLDARLYLAERSKPAAERTPIERQAPGVGVAFVTVVADSGPELRAVAFSGESAELGNEQMANPELKKAGLRFYLDLVAPMEMRLVVRPDGSVVLVDEVRGTVKPPRPLHAGELLPLPETVPAVAVGEVVRNAEERFDVVRLPPETDAEYMRNGLSGVNEQEGAPAVRVRVHEQGSAPYERLIVGADPWGRPMIVASRDRRLRLELVSTDESMYRSAVQALDSRGNVLGEHVVRVNTPFRMGGYEFYQNQFEWNPQRGGPMSAFRVKYDPMVPWIYFGFVLIAGGVIVLLWFPGQRAFKLHAHLTRLPEAGPGG
jgi:hypothetical protein